jgi:hypothetical protein
MRGSEIHAAEGGLGEGADGKDKVRGTRTSNGVKIWGKVNVSLLANAVNDRGVFLVDARALGTAQHIQRHVFQLDAQIFVNRSSEIT